MLQAEIKNAVKCLVKTCTPEEFLGSPEIALGALVVSPPGVLPMLTAALPKDRPPIVVLYSSAETHFEAVRKLTRSSIIAVVSVSETFLKTACGILAPMTGPRHTLIECLIDEHKDDPIPSADLLFCDVITFPRLRTRSRANKVIPYNLISPECLNQIAATMAS
jgi:hypothetical protein